MTLATLQSAWKEWKQLADNLDLSTDSGDDSRSLHARLFRLSSAHLPRAGHLHSVRRAISDALDPWLSVRSKEKGLARLRRTMSACMPAWKAMMARPVDSALDFDEVERVARSVGHAASEESYWLSPLVNDEVEFDPITALARLEQKPASGLCPSIWPIATIQAGNSV